MSVFKRAAIAASLFISCAVHAACSLSLRVPVGGPFPAVDIEGFVWLHQPLASLALPGKSLGGEVDALPLHAYWTTRITADDSPGPLGAGWFVPLLESRCTPAGHDELVMVTPEGYSQKLRITRRMANGREQFPRRLEGSGWLGTQDSNKIVRISSSCGDRLVFDGKGRLAEVAVDGRSYTLLRNPKGNVSELKLNNITPLVSFEYDDTGRLASYRPSGGALATCRYSLAPALSSNGKWVELMSLAEIAFSDGGSLSFEYRKDPACVAFSAQPVVRWDPSSRMVLSVGEIAYGIIPHPGNFGGAEFKLVKPDGATMRFYNDIGAGVLTKTDDDGVTKVTRRVVTGPLAGVVRSVSVLEGGAERLVEKYDYDSKGNCIYVFMRGVESRTRYDDKGRAVEFSHGDTEEFTSYAADGSVRVVLSVRGKLVSTSVRINKGSSTFDYIMKKVAGKMPSGVNVGSTDHLNLVVHFDIPSDKPKVVISLPSPCLLYTSPSPRD